MGLEDYGLMISRLGFCLVDQKCSMRLLIPSSCETEHRQVSQGNSSLVQEKSRKQCSERGEEGRVLELHFRMIHSKVPSQRDGDRFSRPE